MSSDEAPEGAAYKARRGWRFWRRPSFGEQVAEVLVDHAARLRGRRDEAHLDAVIEMTERAAIPCVTCDDIGEPHVCERQWWADRLAHHQGQACSDAECSCHVSLRLQQEARQLWPTR